MNEQNTESLLKVLADERQKLEQGQPELSKGFEAFQQSFAAYQRMTQQFQTPSEVNAAARVYRAV
jgi:hypothetical protein